jgi:hypothetical protein
MIGKARLAFDSAFFYSFLKLSLAIAESKRERKETNERRKSKM